MSYNVPAALFQELVFDAAAAAAARGALWADSELASLIAVVGSPTLAAAAAASVSGSPRTFPKSGDNNTDNSNNNNNNAAPPAAVDAEESPYEQFLGVEEVNLLLRRRAPPRGARFPYDHPDTCMVIERSKNASVVAYTANFLVRESDFSATQNSGSNRVGAGDDNNKKENNKKKKDDDKALRPTPAEMATRKFGSTEATSAPVNITAAAAAAFFPPASSSAAPGGTLSQKQGGGGGSGDAGGDKKSNNSKTSNSSTTCRMVPVPSGVGRHAIIDAREPVRAYWVKIPSAQQRHDGIMDLKYIEKKFAFGVGTTLYSLKDFSAKALAAKYANNTAGHQTANSTTASHAKKDATHSGGGGFPLHSPRHRAAAEAALAEWHAYFTPGEVTYVALSSWPALLLTLPPLASPSHNNNSNNTAAAAAEAGGGNENNSVNNNNNGGDVAGNLSALSLQTMGYAGASRASKGGNNNDNDNDDHSLQQHTSHSSNAKVARKEPSETKSEHKGSAGAVPDKNNEKGNAMNEANNHTTNTNTTATTPGTATVETTKGAAPPITINTTTPTASRASCGLPLTDTTAVMVAVVGGELSVLTRVYVKSIEPKHFYQLPSVEYIEAFGVSLLTGEDTYEKKTR